MESYENILKNLENIHIFNEKKNFKIEIKLNHKKPPNRSKNHI